MAIARCEKHKPIGRKHEYRAYALPVGYPQTAAICGHRGCDEPARVWLTDEDRQSYAQGIRIFDIRTDSAKLRVSDGLIAAETLPE